MNREAFALTLALAAPAFLGACSGPTPPAATDLSAEDLTSPTDQRGAPADAAAPDLRPALDMAPPTVTGLPTDCAAGGTAAQLYTNVIQSKCATTNCHGATGSVHFSITAASDLKAKWVGKQADQTFATKMNLVTAGNLNQSYVLYKLVNQQEKASDSPGGQMPLGGTALGHDDLCRFISWIQGGAN